MVHVLEPVVHVLELEHIFRTSTRKVHTEQEQVVVVQMPEHLFKTSTQQELEPLLETGTRQAHTVLLQRTMLKSLTTT